jgi:RNA polymerase sigma-70 factor (ECF subfamily)
MDEQQTDRHIIDLYFARDERAITETDRHYGGFCLRVSLGILDDRRDAEECVNDTYLKAWNSIPPTRPRSLRAFLAKIVRNLSLQRFEYNHAAKRNRDFEIALEELGDCIPMRDEDADQLPALLDQFLSQLEEPEWQLFCGRYWHGHSVKELARTHGLTPKAVTMRLFRTREKLRLFLTERGYHV